MRKRIVFTGVFLAMFAFLAIQCSAALVDPRKPRKTGASIYKNRRGTAKPVTTTYGTMQKEQPAAKEAMKAPAQPSKYTPSKY